MSEENSTTSWWNPIKVGILLTIIVVAGFIAMALSRNCIILPSDVLECRRNWEWFWSSPPNEIGDTLAGFAGTLAFIWIVTTVWLQSNELSEQRRELALTREELRLARQAQEKMVEAAQIQASIFSNEKLVRDQSQRFSEICALVEEIMRLAKLEPILSTDWRFQKEIAGGNTSTKMHSLLVAARDYRASLSPAEISNQLSEAILKSNEVVSMKIAEGWTLSSRPILGDLLHELLRMISRVDNLYENVSEADKVRVKSLDLYPLQAAIEEIENHPNYWTIWGKGEAP